LEIKHNLLPGVVSWNLEASIPEYFPYMQEWECHLIFSLKSLLWFVFVSSGRTWSVKPFLRAACRLLCCGSILDSETLLHTST
jgi:hypothetical protein